MTYEDGGKSRESPHNITSELIREIRKRYPTQVPQSLRTLDEQRRSTIPKALSKRRETMNAHLKRSELITLVDWKLKHGKFRPNLAKLAASNSEEDVKAVTQEAFSKIELTGDLDATRASEAFAILTKLRGVGPATASLLLSSYDPVRIPFFADELYRYMNWKSPSNASINGRHGSDKTAHSQPVDWSLKIGYTKKEYLWLCQQVIEQRKRLQKESKYSVSALDLEDVAYVLGHEAHTQRASLSKKRSSSETVEESSSESRRLKVKKQ